MRVAVDAMGGDNAPEPLVVGAIRAATEGDIDVCLVGDEEAIRASMPAVPSDVARRVSIHHTEDAIRMDESALEAIRRDRASVSVAAQLVSRGEADALVSMGNTGAAMVAGATYLRCIEGVDRPAIGLSLPTASGDPFLLVDAGATADCRPVHLLQFGMMGSTYCRDILRIPEPRVGLVSNGEERAKGSQVYKNAHKLLRASSLNFVGNVEPNAMLRGAADVVVCDGFVGNIILKTLEGFVDLATHWMACEFRRSLWNKVVGVAARPILRRTFRARAYDNWGGAVLLGVNGVLVIGHGRSNERAVANAIGVARDACERRVVEHIREAAAAFASRQQVANGTNGNGEPGP